MVKKVYIETTIISYLTARSSKNILATAWQELTKEWWTHRRTYFDLFTSELVLAEAYKGDAESCPEATESLGGYTYNRNN